MKLVVRSLCFGSVSAPVHVMMARCVDSLLSVRAEEVRRPCVTAAFTLDVRAMS